MDQKEDLCPALRHRYTSTELWELWPSMALLQQHQRGHLALADLDNAFWGGPSKWRVSNAYFSLNLAFQLGSHASEIQSKLEFTDSHLNIVFFSVNWQDNLLQKYLTLRPKEKKKALASIIAQNTARHHQRKAKRHLRRNKIRRWSQPAITTTHFYICFHPSTC